MNSFPMNKDLVFSFILTVLTSACSDPVPKFDDRTVFKYNEAAGISSLDPAFARSFENVAATNQIYNGLVQVDKNLNVLPSIARSWEITDSGKVYTFHLRKDVYFHDHNVFPDGKGRKVTAEDFVLSFNRILNPDLASPGAWIFNEVDFSAKTDYNGFSAPDDSTFVIRLKRAFPPFLGILTMQYCSVIPMELVMDKKNDFSENPIGTGPFMFKAWKQGTKLVLVKNPHYWETDSSGMRLPYLDAVSISFTKDRHSELISFLEGDLDMVSGLDPAYKDELLTSEGELHPDHSENLKILRVPFLKTDYLGILVDENLPGTKNSPLLIREVRQAINYGFDRNAIVKFLRNTIGKPAVSGFVPYGMPGFTNDIKGYEYNPARARELLNEAGFPNGKNMPAIVLTTTAQYQDLCEFIQNQLSEIGIKIKINVVPTTIHADLSANGKLNFFRKSWVADYPDGENFLSLFYSRNFSPDGPNYTHFKSSKYDSLYEQSILEPVDSLRLLIYQQMERIIIEEAPVVPLFYDEAIRFHHKGIKGFEINPMNLLSLKKVKKGDPN